MSQAASPRQAAAWRRRVLLGVGIAAVVVVVWAVLVLSGVGDGVAVAVAAVLSGVASSLASLPVERGASPVVPAAPVPDASADTIRQLRHDLRGILSPALMTADRLLMTTQDPIARRAAEAMIETVEAAERRLSV